MLFVARQGKRAKFTCKASFAAKFFTHFPFSSSSDKKTAAQENSHQRWQKTAGMHQLTDYDCCMVQRRHTTGAFDEKALKKMTE